mmetsp:Transcript_38276/g.100975  ORF Transcript_38276/g.100975 Transcript_38276/m.100975 type:complete len:112 (+) Transcript_38276:1625-1960(+)
MIVLDVKLPKAVEKCHSGWQVSAEPLYAPLIGNVEETQRHHIANLFGKDAVKQIPLQLHASHISEPIHGTTRKGSFKAVILKVGVSQALEAAQGIRYGPADEIPSQVKNFK